MNQPEQESKHTEEPIQPADDRDVSEQENPMEPSDEERQVTVLEAEHTSARNESPEATLEAPETAVKVIDEPVSHSITTTTSSSPLLTEPSGQAGAGILVLQWLSYAFWFWFGLAMCWLSAVVINYYVSGETSAGYSWGNQLAYPLASVIIMLIIAFITDWLYARHEPEKKTGGANIIMLLHVVPFVLIAIGGIVSVVFAMINMALNNNPVANVDGTITVMIVSAITALLFAAAAVRVFFGKKQKVRIVTIGLFVLVAIGFIIAGLAGPAAEAARTKNDRLIEQALPSLAGDIREYTGKHKALPQKLSDVTHTDGYSSSLVQKLIDSNLVSYKANTVSDASSKYDPSDVDVQTCVEDASVSGACYSGGSSSWSSGSNRFYYQLCTTYAQEKKDTYDYTEDTSYTSGNGVGSVSNYRSSYLTSIAAHPAGQVCYNLYADGGYSDGIEPMTSASR